MTEGIDKADLTAVFITQNYIRKVAGKGPKGDDDNCKFEFDYACMRRGVARVIPIVFEPKCRDTSRWEGPVGMKLGTKLYSDLSGDGEEFLHAIDKLEADIKRAVGLARKTSVSELEVARSAESNACGHFNI